MLLRGNFTEQGKAEQQLGTIFKLCSPMTDGKRISFFKGLCYPRAWDRLMLPLLRQVERRLSPKVILEGTRVVFALLLLLTILMP